MIIRLRSPVERACARYLHMIQRGWEGCATFEDALTKEKDRIREGAFWGFHYDSAGFYAAQVQRIIDLFDRGRVIVIIFKHGKKDRSCIWMKSAASSKLNLADSESWGPRKCDGDSALASNSAANRRNSVCSTVP